MTTETTETGQAQKYSILLVDDDRFLLDMYAKKFGDEGHVVKTCQSVHDAIAALEGGFVADAIVFDLLMPQEDGFDLLRIIKEKNLKGHAVLIALTNQVEEDEEAKTESLGADGFIVKATMIPSEVFNTVHDLIMHHKQA